MQRGSRIWALIPLLMESMIIGVLVRRPRKDFYTKI